ncbi:DUF2924 domain-containing protein [Mesorhizobium sp. M1A.F.Ca.ET.072.01.1.1]|uniref:DUF2924 domain-containing protein n=1 Tax=Mesorhizobium sp. M1A.F.Ca.ET.072.01.1.1 TaxID=2496753 RepID=UPI000FD27173|nr:DUF2924 domain-containing protein [Mesorhizobium sp. M1A.F.Ca.ET.072.01.1.1]RUW55483.1 DUF2924 domain-containing protein [Mesorhizobium sp. M1A.F.Ca.ET.072.01.1.1]TIV04605.1 MAG: DUF2924 domain-containing protein [Mesorhizobium sp.]
MRAKLDIEAEVAAFSDLSREELAAQWEKIYRCSPPKGVRRELLTRAAAWHLQAKRLGGFSTETRRLLKSAIERVEKKIADRDSQANVVVDDIKVTIAPKRKHVLPGARLVRDWNGKTHIVDVIEDGFVFEAKVYPSLSSIARKITGAHWSGPRFFGL